MRTWKSLAVLASVAALGIAGSGLTTAASASTHPSKPHPAVIYNSMVSSPGNLPSVGAEAYAFNEFGNQVHFAGSNRHLTRAVVTMSTWGCQTGSWNAGTCLTSPGASFKEPITLNIYGPSTDGINPGTLITSVTQTFTIPYRPSASPRCTGTSAGQWYDWGHKTCFNGKAVNLTFTIGGWVPSTVVYGIAYNTTHFGYHPIGEAAACFTSSGGCGYDSLNIGLSQDPTNVRVGRDTTAGKVWQNSTIGSEYCDAGAAGTGTFRIDSPNVPSCWGVNAPYTTAPFYVPAVQFTAVGGRG